MARLLTVPTTFAAGYLGILRGDASNPPTAGDVANCFKFIVADVAASATTAASNAFGINPGVVFGEDGNIRIWNGSTLVLPDRDFGTTGLLTDLIEPSSTSADLVIENDDTSHGVVVKLGTATSATYLKVKTSAGATVFTCDATGAVTVATMTTTGLVNNSTLTQNGSVTASATDAAASGTDYAFGVTQTHATGSVKGLAVTMTQGTNNKTSGTVSAIKGAIVGRAGDTSGATYAAFEAAATTNSGSAHYAALLAGAGFDRLLDASAMATGQAVISLPTNVAVALREQDITANKIYRDIITTTGSESVAYQQRLTSTDGVASGDTRIIGGQVNSAIANGTALTGSTAETLLGTKVLAASALKAGTRMIVRYAVEVSVGGNASKLTVCLRLGATTLTGTALITSVAPAGAVTNDVGIGEYTLTARAAPGAAASCTGYGMHQKPGAIGTAVLSAFTTPTNFATSSALRVEVTGQWDANDANSCRLTQLDVDLVG